MDAFSCGILVCFVTARMGKVMFSQASVILFAGVGLHSHNAMLRVIGQQAGATLPTGMHPCFLNTNKNTNINYLFEHQKVILFF